MLNRPLVSMLRLHHGLHPMQFAWHDIFSGMLNVVILDGGHLEGNLPTRPSELALAVLSLEDSVSYLDTNVLLSCSTAKE